MIKYELDKNNFMTGNWCSVGGFENQVETEETEIDLNKYWNGNNWEIGENPKLKQSQIEKEIKELKQWYDINYAQHEQKFRRLHSLGKLTDEGDNPYDELIKLYNEAEIKRARIQELERLLSDNS